MIPAALSVFVTVVVLHQFEFGQCDVIELKVVDEPSSFGSVGANSYGGINPQDKPPLKLRVQPANFSGPAHLKRLVGRCYTSIINDYKYSFCPFNNVTQHEQGIHWNPYNGVLGVWQEWEVHNNTFAAMMMKDGDSCGDIFRSVKVQFECGPTNQILNVSEPERCRYLLQYRTPLVCHRDSMLVYPTLPPPLQHRWDTIEGERLRGELTDKGYRVRLQQLFEDAGIHLSSKGHARLVEKAEEVKKEKIKDGEFETLDTCKAEYKKLQEEVKDLVGRLGLNGNEETHQERQNIGQ